MNENEKALLDKIKSEVKTVVDGETKATKETVETLKSELAKVSASATATEEVKAEVVKIAGVLKAMQEEAVVKKETAKKSFASHLVDGFIELSKKNGQFADLRKGQFVNIEVKAAGTMTTANIDAVGTNSIPFTLAEYESGLTRVQRRKPFLFELVNTGTTSKGYVQWAEQANVDGGAGTTAEGVLKNLADFDVQEKSAKVEKVTAYIKVSKEMLDDAGYMDAEIRNELIEIVMLKMDEQILSGNGTSPQLAGLLSFAQTWGAGAFALTIENANNFDVIRTAINQVEKENFMPNYIVMHPTDVAKMDLAKDSTGMYVMPPFITAGGNTIKGLPIISNTGVTEGDFLVGDFTKSILRVRENANISVGYENDDFTKNLVTILCEMRGVHYVKSNHAKAFVKGTFSTAITALEKP
jgi:HK97 family phage major capsid protein